MLPVAILCGGLGTRLWPRTKNLPKALIPVNGEPFIAHQLRLLRGQGVRRVVLCVSFLGEMIEAVVGTGDEFGLDVVYSYDGPDRRGTGGAISMALPLLGDRFLSVYGDSYLVTDYRAVERSFDASGMLGQMTVWRNQGRLAPSNVEMIDNTIVRYDKSAGSKTMEYIDWGLNAFQAEAFRPFEGGGAFDLGNVHAALVARGQLAAHEVQHRFYEVGSPAGLAQTEAYLAKP